MALEDRLLKYEEGLQDMCINSILARSVDGTCIICSAYFEEKDGGTVPVLTGTVKAINVIKQEGNLQKLSSTKKRAYEQKKKELCHRFQTKLDCLNEMTTESFLVPTKLDEKMLERELQSFRSFSYVIEPVTYTFQDWEEETAFGVDLLIFKKDNENLEWLKEIHSKGEKKEEDEIKDTEDCIEEMLYILQHIIEQKKAIEHSKKEIKIAEKKIPPSCILMKEKQKIDEIFGKSIDRSSIVEIVFHNSQEISSLSNDAWNVAEAKDGSVMACVKENVLHICGKGKVLANPDSSFLFYQYKNVKKIDFGNCFDTSRVVNMNSMFRRCEQLIDLDISKFDTSNVTNMTNMFWNCQSIETLNVSHFNTKNVQNMSGMFNRCEQVKMLDVGKWDTRSVLQMKELFNCCMQITSLDLSKWNTSQVITMESMFEECYNLKKLNIQGLDTSNVMNMKRMFAECEQLTNLDVSTFCTSKVNHMGSMFLGCENLKSLNVSTFDTSKVNNMDLMFYNCKKLQSLDLSKFNTSKLQSSRNMFDGCSYSVMKNNKLKVKKSWFGW